MCIIILFISWIIALRCTRKAKPTAYGSGTKSGKTMTMDFQDEETGKKITQSVSTNTWSRWTTQSKTGKNTWYRRPEFRSLIKEPNVIPDFIILKRRTIEQEVMADFVVVSLDFNFTFMWMNSLEKKTGIWLEGIDVLHMTTFFYVARGKICQSCLFDFNWIAIQLKSSKERNMISSAH